MGNSDCIRRLAGLRALLLVFALVCALTALGCLSASAADVTIYVDTSAIDARTDLTKDEKDQVKAAIKQEIKSNLESAFGTDKVEVTDDAAKKKSANRTVTIKNDLGTDTDKDGNTTHHWGEWEHGSSNVNVHVKNYMERWGSSFKTGNPPKWNTASLGKALGTTAAHEVSHSYSAGHDDKNINKMNTANDATELGGGLNLNDAAKKTLGENKANPPCKAVTNYSTECCIADWWSDPLAMPGHELHESRSITALATFGGPLAPMFDLGWWGPDTDNGVLDGNPWGNFVYKSSMQGSLFDAPTITFFDGWTVHFVLRGRPGSPFAGNLIPALPHQMMLLDPIIRPDGTEIYRQIELACEIDGMPGPDVHVHLTTDAFGPASPMFSGFRRGLAPSERLPTGEAKMLPEGSYASVAAATVTRVFADHFYVQASDRSAGIRVQWWGSPGPSPVPVEGSGLLLEGVVATNPDGERMLRADPSRAFPLISLPVAPLSMANRTVGADAFHYHAGLWPSGQEGVPGLFGLNNIGLLVRTWGRVTQIDEPVLGPPQWLRIDDGAHRNIKCLVTDEAPLHPALLGRYVSVTGISSCERDNEGNLVSLIKVNRPFDLTLLD